MAATVLAHGSKAAASSTDVKQKESKVAGAAADTKTQQCISDFGKKHGVVCGKGTVLLHMRWAFPCFQAIGHSFHSPAYDSKDSPATSIKKKVEESKEKAAAATSKSEVADTKTQQCKEQHLSPLLFNSKESTAVTDIKKKADESKVKAAAVGAATMKSEIADTRTQQCIADVGKKHGVVCDKGTAWCKTTDGYCCTSGGHSLTFKQLGIAPTSPAHDCRDSPATSLKKKVKELKEKVKQRRSRSVPRQRARVRPLRANPPSTPTS
jgi:hypothetical protein